MAMREGEGGVQVMATREREYKRTRQDSAEGQVGEAREGEDGGKRRTSAIIAFKPRGIFEGHFLGQRTVQ